MNPDILDTSKLRKATQSICLIMNSCVLLTKQSKRQSCAMVPCSGPTAGLKGTHIIVIVLNSLPSKVQH